MTLLFGLLQLCETMEITFLVKSPILYLAFLLAVFPFIFMPSKPSFLHDHSITQHSDFSSVLAVSTTVKPVNQSIQAYALTQLNVFALRGFIFCDIHKRQGRSLSNSGYEIQKIFGWKIYLCARTFGEEVHKSNIQVKRWHITSMKIVNYIERHNFCEMICLPSPIILKYRLIK